VQPGTPATAYLSCYDTELIGFVVFAKRGRPTLLANGRPDCKSELGK
jgi:hypothetical protein